MGSHRLIILAVILAVLFPLHALGESIDGRVVQIELPVDDVTLTYVEASGAMAIELSTPNASVMGTKFYVGDGKVAVELVAHELQGIYFQGKIKLNSGFKFKKYSVVEVLPGYKRAADLAPGDVYVTLHAVTFTVPAK